MNMANTTLNLSIPAELKEKARSQARARHFSSTSDYLQHLIRADVEQSEHKKTLETFLQKGLDSGDGEEMTLEQLGEWMTQVIKKAE